MTPECGLAPLQRTSDRNKGGGDGAGFAGEDVVGAAGGAGVHGVGGDACCLQSGAQGERERLQARAATEQADINLSGERKDGR